MQAIRTGDSGAALPTSRRILSSSRILERIVMFTIVWWILVEGYPGSWGFGAGFVILATAASLKLTPLRTWTLRPIGVARFAGFFAWHSIAGGVDVAMRAIRPSMPIAPGFVSCPMRLTDMSARVLLADTVSLLPGTLSAGMEGDLLVIHVLDCRLPIVEDVRVVEDQISRALGIELAPVVPSGNATSGTPDSAEAGDCRG
jgi:multicomponent Na+:H+ antiporter subunit E